MERSLTDLEITARIVPTMLRWPSSEQETAWNKLRDAVESLRNLVRALNHSCCQIEGDRHLKPDAIAHRRMELGNQTLARLVTFEPVERCERAVNRISTDLIRKHRLCWRKDLMNYAKVLPRRGVR